MFEAEHITVCHTIALPRPAATCLPLFTPKGELDWIPSWRPTFLHPADGTTTEGMVFTTPGPDGAMVAWIMTLNDPAHGRVRYSRVTPSLAVVTIAVTVRADGRDAASAEVAYDLVGLSPEGNAANRAFADGFVAMIEDWRRLIHLYFGAPLTAFA